MLLSAQSMTIGGEEGSGALIWEGRLFLKTRSKGGAYSEEAAYLKEGA